jgi:hypothetical protein
MEKKHTALQAFIVKAMIEAGNKVRLRCRRLAGGAALGFDFVGIYWCYQC